jgi:hypothetical protein
MDWLRMYNDMPFDKKWPLVSRRSGQPILTIVGVWAVMLGCAGDAKERGTLEGWDDEVIAAAMGVETEVISSVREAMQGLTLDGFRLIAWENRQRISDDVSARVKKHREAKKAPPDGGNSGGNGAETGRNEPKPNGSHGNEHVTTCNVTETGRNVAVTDFPLRATDSDSEEESKRGGTRAGARGEDIDWLCQEISRLTNLPVTPSNRKVVAEMIERGADPVEDILPGVQAKLDATQVPHDQIDGFGFFRNAVDKHRHQRLNPPPARPANVAKLRSVRRVPIDDGHERILRRYAEEQAAADRMFGDRS